MTVRMLESGAVDSGWMAFLSNTERHGHASAPALGAAALAAAGAGAGGFLATAMMSARTMRPPGPLPVTRE